MLIASQELSRAGIPIHWDDGGVQPIKIRRSYNVEMFGKLRCIPLKPGCGQGYDAWLMMDNEATAVFGSSPGRQTT
jgi:hypothetical protein